jgi:long-chain acyl-CoA synthetase
LAIEIDGMPDPLHECHGAASQRALHPAEGSAAAHAAGAGEAHARESIPSSPWFPGASQPLRPPSGNVAGFLARHLGAPGRVLYRQFRDGRWRDVAVRELVQRIARWQAALRREGLREGDRVAIALRNGVDWVAVDLAALGLGLVVVPLYVDDRAESAAYCIEQTGARLAVVENSRVASALRAARSAGAAFPPAVVLGPDADTPDVPASAFLTETDGEIAIRPVAGATLATICFTSGTAGRPKGVMLSHQNIVANVLQCEATGMAGADDRFLSILPLSHMFERTGGYYLPLALGATVVFTRGVADLADDLRAARPTVMFAVPRIFERMRAGIERSLARAPARRRLLEACVDRGGRVAAGRAAPADRLLWALLRAWVGRPVRARLGGRLRLAVVGGAALDPGLARMFIALGVPLLQGYGMTEASPVIAVNRDGDNDPETVGPPLPGIDVRLAPSGELLVRGANVMLGYWRDEAATRAAIDADGWLHTGDLAELRDGKLAIHGRAKDIFVLSNGEKLSPQDVESAILRDPAFEQVMLVGERRPYATLLAVTAQTDEAALVRRANQCLTAFPRWVRVRRVIATTEPWTVENGLLTPTHKLRRPELARRFEALIERAYRDAPPR